MCVPCVMCALVCDLVRALADLLRPPLCVCFLVCVCPSTKIDGRKNRRLCFCRFDTCLFPTKKTTEYTSRLGSFLVRSSQKIRPSIKKITAENRPPQSSRPLAIISRDQPIEPTNPCSFCCFIASLAKRRGVCKTDVSQANWA